MAMLKKLVIVVFTLIVLMGAGSFLLPASYEVERSISVKAPKERVYPYLVDLTTWPQWGAWFIRDPDMQVSYSGPDRAIGMTMTWLSQTEGNGTLVITALEHQHKMTYALTFPDMGTRSTGAFVLVEDSETGHTQITWRDTGELGNNPLYRYFGLVIDGMIGPDFETGLENLKTVVEMNHQQG